MADPARLKLPSGWPDTPADAQVASAVSTGPDTVTLALEVAADCPWLEGHFPGQAVLPGVVQLRWALQLAAIIWPDLQTVAAINNLKFQNPVLPPTPLRLELHRYREQPRVDFSYHLGEQRCALGRVVFK